MSGIRTKGLHKGRGKERGERRTELCQLPAEGERKALVGTQGRRESVMTWGRQERSASLPESPSRLRECRVQPSPLWRALLPALDKLDILWAPDTPTSSHHSANSPLGIVPATGPTPSLDYTRWINNVKRWRRWWWWWQQPLPLRSLHVPRDTTQLPTQRM